MTWLLGLLHAGNLVSVVASPALGHHISPSELIPISRLFQDFRFGTRFAHKCNRKVLEKNMFKYVLKRHHIKSSNTRSIYGCGTNYFRLIIKITMIENSYLYSFDTQVLNPRCQSHVLGKYPLGIVQGSSVVAFSCPRHSDPEPTPQAPSMVGT